MNWELVGYWAGVVGFVALLVLLWAETVEAVAKGQTGWAATVSPVAVMFTIVALITVAMKMGWID